MYYLTQNFFFEEVIEDTNDDDQQLQMALQMSLDEISIAKSRSLSNKNEDNSETVLPPNNAQEESNTKTDIPVLLPK